MPKVPAEYIEARREAIIEAARRAFVRKGTDATTMAEIARETGLTPGALYRYFPTKDDLISCCFSDARTEVSQRWMQDPEPGVDPLDDLAELAQLTFSTLNLAEERMNTIIHLEHELALVREGADDQLQDWRNERDLIAQKVHKRLARGQELGDLPKEIDPALLADALLSFYWGARLNRVLEPEADTDGQLRQLLLLMGHASPRD